QQQQPHSGGSGSRRRQVESNSRQKGDGSRGKREDGGKGGSKGGTGSRKKRQEKDGGAKEGDGRGLEWSGAFDIDKPGESAVRIRHRRKKGKYAILSMIDVSLNGASALVTFDTCSSKHKPPPYRNSPAASFPVHLGFRNSIDQRPSVPTLPTCTPPFFPPSSPLRHPSSCQPRMAQLLQVEIEGFGVTREYDLDGIRELPTIILSEDDFTGNASLRDRYSRSAGEVIASKEEQQGTGWEYNLDGIRELTTIILSEDDFTGNASLKDRYNNCSGKEQQGPGGRGERMVGEGGGGKLPTIILSEDDFTGNASLRDRMFVMVGTQARAVAALYVNVYADGATRVLSFSDTKHTSKVSEEDERTTLQEKLQVTSERIDFARKVLQRTVLSQENPHWMLRRQRSGHHTAQEPPPEKLCPFLHCSCCTTAKEARASGLANSRTVSDCSDASAEHVKSHPGKAGLRRSRSQEAAVLQAGKGELSAKGEGKAEKGKGVAKEDSGGSEVVGKGGKGEGSGEETHAEGSNSHSQEAPREFGLSRPEAGVLVVKARDGGAGKGWGRWQRSSVKENVGPCVGAVKSSAAEIPAEMIVEGARYVRIRSSRGEMDVEISSEGAVKGGKRMGQQLQKQRKGKGRKKSQVPESKQDESDGEDMKSGYGGGGEERKPESRVQGPVARRITKDLRTDEVSEKAGSLSRVREESEEELNEGGEEGVEQAACSDAAAAKTEPTIHLDSLSSFPPLNCNRIQATPLSAPTADPNTRGAAAALPLTLQLQPWRIKQWWQIHTPTVDPNTRSAAAASLSPSSRSLGESSSGGKNSDKLSANPLLALVPADHSSSDLQLPVNVQPSESAELEHHRSHSTEVAPALADVATGGAAGEAAASETPAVDDPPSNSFQPSPELDARPTRGRVTWKGVVGQVGVGATAAVVNTGKRVTGAASALHSAAAAFLDGTSEKVQEKFHEAQEAFEEAEERAGEWRADEGFKSATSGCRRREAREERWVSDGEGNELMPVPTLEELQSMAGAVAAAELEFIGRNRPTGLVKSASVAAGQMAAVARRGQDVVAKAGSMVKGAVGSALAAGSEAAVAEGLASEPRGLAETNAGGGIGVEEEEDISELRQERIQLGNEEYDAGAIVGGDVTVHVIKAMDLGLRPEKTHPYAVVQVEGRRLRSSVCKGTVCPQWDELLVFKGVSTASSMAISIFSSETIGSHKFLGQVVLPLVDGRALNREPGWHKLSRRTAHETVTGRVFLSTSWDATELELMALQVAACQGSGAGRTGAATGAGEGGTLEAQRAHLPSPHHSLLLRLPLACPCARSPLQLRAKEAELDALEERLAQEREARPREAVMAAETLANPHPLQPHTPSSALRTPTGGPMLRRMFTLRGPGGMGAAAASSVSPAVVQQHAAKGQLKGPWGDGGPGVMGAAASSVSPAVVQQHAAKGQLKGPWGDGGPGVMGAAASSVSPAVVQQHAAKGQLKVSVGGRERAAGPCCEGGGGKAPGSASRVAALGVFGSSLPLLYSPLYSLSAHPAPPSSHVQVKVVEARHLAVPAEWLRSVKVVEARHLAVPAEWLRSVHRMRAFAALSVVSPSGTSTLPVKTRVINGTFFPKWNETFSINDAALASSLRVQVFDKPKLGSPNLLGEATVDVTTFKDGLPQYMLLTLKRSAGKEGVRICLFLPPFSFFPTFLEQEAVGGSIRLRVHWMVDHGKKAEEKTGVNFMLNLHGMTVSVVDRLPREIMLLLLEDICCSWEESVKEVAGKVEVGKLQVDNQLLTARNPVVLSRTQAFPAEALFMEQSKELANQASLASMLSTDPKEKEKAFVSVEFTRLLQHPSIVYYRRFLFQLQEFDLVLEEDFVDTAVAYLQQLPMDDLWQEAEKRGGKEEEEKKEADEDLVEDMTGAPITRTYLPRDATMVSPTSRRHLVKSEPLVNSSSWVAGNQGLRWYFERFQVQSMRINVTLVMNPIKSDAPPPSGSSSEWHLRTTASSAGFPLISLTRAPLRLNSLVLDNAFQNQSTLQTYVLRHYGVQLLQGLHKILGSVELLGAPLSLVDNLATGVMDFFVEPASATTPEEFLNGAVKGTVSLMKHSSYGVLHSISSLAGGIGSGFAKLTFDDSFIQRFSQRPEGTSQQVLRGAQDVGLGFVGAVTGLVLQPLEGARREGAVGAVKGMGKGVVGLVTKPLSGLLGFASTLTESAGTGIRAIGGDVTRRSVPRIRLPSTFGRNDAISLEPEDSVELKLVLAILDFGRYRDEHLLDHLQTSGRMAVLFTVARLIFYDCQRNVFYWQIPLKDITSVMGMEGRLESIILYDADVVIAGKKLPLRMPARKVIKTTTRELHMALLVKLNRHLARIRAALPSSSATSPHRGSRDSVAASTADDASHSSSRPLSAGSSPVLSPSPSLPSPLRLAQSPGNVSEASAVGGKVAGRSGGAAGAGVGRSSSGGGAADRTAGRVFAGSQFPLTKILSAQREQEEEGEKEEKEEEEASESARGVSVAGGVAAATGATRWRKQTSGRGAAGAAADKGKSPVDQTHSGPAPVRAKKSSFRRGKSGGFGGGDKLGKQGVIWEDADVEAAQVDQGDSDEDDYREDANGGAARVAQLDREERQEVRRNLDAILTTCQVASARAGGRADPASALVSSASQAGAQRAAQEASDDDVLIELKDVYKSFGSKHILRGASLKIRRGEAVGVIGPSGTGKSTILKIMAGLLAPDKGEVWICGKKREGLISDQENMGLRIGLVFQSAALFDSLTVRENVGFLLYEHSRLSEEEIRLRVKDSLKAVGLKNVEERFPSELSGGMKKRVALARAIVSDSDAPQLEEEVVMYDEPTAGLDPIASTVVEDLIRSLHVRSSVPVPVTAEIAAGLESDFETESEDSEDEMGGGRGAGGAAGGGSRDGSGSGSGGGSKARKMASVSSYIVVTHQHSTIRRAVDRLLFLYGGEVVWEGPTEEFDTTDNPIVRQHDQFPFLFCSCVCLQFAVGSLDGPIRY
ncbi:unnamed protein product, partial [Closterium sp. Naga37s-1]